MIRIIFILCLFVSCKQANQVAPSNGCCGTLIPSWKDGNTMIQGYAVPNSQIFDHEIRMVISEDLDCSIKTIEVHLTPSDNAPNITSANPVILHFNSCSRNRGAIYLNRWTSFSSDPIGGQYDVILTYKDINGAIVASYAADYALDL